MCQDNQIFERIGNGRRSGCGSFMHRCWCCAVCGIPDNGPQITIVIVVIIIRVIKLPKIRCRWWRWRSHSLSSSFCYRFVQARDSSKYIHIPQRNHHTPLAPRSRLPSSTSSDVDLLTGHGTDKILSTRRYIRSSLLIFRKQQLQKSHCFVDNPKHTTAHTAKPPFYAVNIHTYYRIYYYY